MDAGRARDPGGATRDERQTPGRVKVASREPEAPLAGIPHGSIAPAVSRFRIGTPTGSHSSAVSRTSGFASSICGRLVCRRHDHDPLAVLRCHAHGQPGTVFAGRPPGRVRIGPERKSRGLGRQRRGTALRSVTQLQDATVSLGSWSPDGRSLAFDAAIGDQTRIYLVPVGGGPVKRLTDGTATEIDPEWSRDGRWIYYSSNESGRSAIWKVPADGGARTQLTTEIGFEPRESPDGRSLYFIDRPRNYGLGPTATLKRIPVGGGPAEKVDVPAMPGAWDITERGIVFIFVAGLGGPTDFARAPDVLQIYDFAESRVRTLGTLAFRVGPYGANHFLAASRDGAWAVASHVDRWDRDILIADRFR